MNADDPCPFCWGTGWVTVMEPPGTPVTRPCPEGCLAPEEVPF